MGRVIDMATELEHQLDLVNGEQGDEQAMCLFCQSKKVEPCFGIVHEATCIIKVLRRFIRQQGRDL